MSPSMPPHMPLTPYHIGPHPSDDTIIWKYFKRPYFESLINDSALFFRRVIDFVTDDPNEGTIPQRDQQRDRLLALSRPHPTISSLVSAVTVANGIDGWGMRHATVINCWTMRPTESRMMWIAYAGIGDGTSRGIAIRSTVGMLKKALEGQPEEVNMSSVRYIDYENDVFEDGTGNAMTPILHKSVHGYSDEQEFRLIHRHSMTEPFQKEKLWDEYPGCRATKIKVNLSNLLCEVVMSPNATDDDLNTAQALCASKGVSNATTLFRHSHMHQ